MFSRVISFKTIMYKNILTETFFLSKYKDQNVNLTKTFN